MLFQILDPFDCLNSTSSQPFTLIGRTSRVKDKVLRATKAQSTWSHQADKLTNEIREVERAIRDITKQTKDLGVVDEQHADFNAAVCLFARVSVCSYFRCSCFHSNMLSSRICLFMSYFDSSSWVSIHCEHVVAVGSSTQAGSSCGQDSWGMEDHPWDDIIDCKTIQRIGDTVHTQGQPGMDECSYLSITHSYSSP